MILLLTRFFSKLSPPTCILIATTCISFFFFLWGVQSWKFSFVGDEWDHYKFAVAIVKKAFWLNPLSRTGVFSENPVLGSMYQALFLKIFGISNLSWRISNIVLIFPLSLFFYLWMKTFFDKHSAFAATLFLQTSFYLSNFFKIGYINPQALVLFVINLYLLTKTYQSPSLKKAIISGFFVGISFYVYIGPLFVLFLLPFIVPLLKTKVRTSKKILMLCLLSITYAIIVLPGILDIFSKETVLQKTVIQPEFDSSLQIGLNVVRNFFLFFKNYEVIYNHFVTGPYLDTITQIFLIFGTLLIFYQHKKMNSALFVGLFLSTGIFLGLSSPYPYAPITRGIFLLPFGFALAGIGASRLLQNRRTIPSFVFLMYMMFLINIYRSQIGVFRDVGYTPDALLLRELQIADKEDTPKQRLLLISRENNFNYTNINTTKEAYGIRFKNFSTLKTNEISCEQMKNTKIFIIIWDEKAQEIVGQTTCPFKKDIHYLQNP